MVHQEASNRKSPFFRTHTIGTFALALALVVTLGLSWQLFAYRGLMAYLAEWQFNHLDRFYPLVTIALLTLLIELPLIIVLISRSRSRRTEHLLAKQPGALLTRSKLAYRELMAVAAGVALASVAIAIYANSIGLTATENPINVTTSNGNIAPGSRVQATGTLRLDRIALYESDSLFFARSLRVAPLQTAPNQPIRFLVEVAANQPEPARTSKIMGVAASAAVPRPIVSLYTNAGFSMVQRPTLVVTTIETVRMPFIWTAWTLAVISLLIFALGMAERYWFKNLNRQYADWKDRPDATPAPQGL